MTAASRVYSPTEGVYGGGWCDNAYARFVSVRGVRQSQVACHSKATGR